ncbi:cytochrome b/b6 domain-containing protein [Sphingoaurantiacus capsulatus]|uniref:Cytochrome b/b6 domain-containing protein n=1 Tax=Sphingoaurantiacus capsulatus TaxID=1771310 RepID=A0ABV7X787_9SPHN
MSEDQGTVYRHRLPTRLWHWLNAVAVFCLLMSGLMIFNAHPMLYWGQYGANADTPALKIGSDGKRGYLRIGGWEVTTTGVLGLSRGQDGRLQRLAFPHWATIPSNYNLADGRRWHILFAWVLTVAGIAYLAVSLANGHVRRDLLPRRDELRPRHLAREIADHARLRFPKGEAAARYNSLQKLSYVGVIFGLLPLAILTGWTMSPGLNAAWPWLVDLFGGRQSARTIHFIAATLITLFIAVHLAMVLLAGPVNEVRSMITGRFRLPKERS